ncbi:MAG: exonuclease SbcCD subunit D C-terminal domain-containing protein, partial [Spirochaetaceae bacterium]|nr:exonuclease SbcCD subunit D C-terminal domain-containing protein [Spirochaetaceae bacterium]
RKAAPETAILIIPGNHDSAARLGYGSEIFTAQNIHIVSNPNNAAEPIIIEHKGEKAAFYLLPFLAAGSILPENEGQSFESSASKGSSTGVTSASEIPSSQGEFSFSDPLKGSSLKEQEELVQEAIRRITKRHSELERTLSSPQQGQSSVPSVLAAHLFTLAGMSSESERSFLGTAAEVNPSLFRPFSYTALGHLHKTQRISDRVWYAGSPLAYSFDETNVEKNLLQVNLDTRSSGFPVSVEKIPLKPLRSLKKLSGSFTDFHNDSSYLAYSGDYLEIELTDGEIVENPMALLRPRYPLLLSIRQRIVQEETETEDIRERISRMGQDGRISPRDDCEAFLTGLYGSADPEKLDLFEQFAAQAEKEEAENETPQA